MATLPPQPVPQSLLSIAPPPQLPYPSDRMPHEPSYQAPNERLFYLPHTCSPACLNRIRPARLDQYRSRNPLLTPLLYEFRRMTGRRRVNRKVGSRRGPTAPRPSASGAHTCILYPLCHGLRLTRRN